jgi:alpha-L-fucosidase
VIRLQKEKSGEFVGRVDYTPEDVRFTRSKDNKTLYAICLGLPENTVTIESAKVKKIEQDAKIMLLEDGQELKYAITDRKLLKIHPPASSSLQNACVFKIIGFEFEE